MIKKKKYDERQQITRGKAYKYGFLSVFFYTMLYFVTTCVAERQFMQADTALMFGLLIGVAVFTDYCILNEAFFTFNNKSVIWTVIIFLTVAAMNAVSGIRALYNGMIIDKNGMLTGTLIPLMICILFVVIVVTILIKTIVSKTSREDE